ncbi:hypothetical protein V5O48_003670 [Marasmius crinis-equi]|uniref:Uncharacterized protein n=1 Tax=Marasmius crinis-equi TaxID=585013 RepID=A0ABR3FT80_9AGAR
MLRPTADLPDLWEAFELRVLRVGFDCYVLLALLRGLKGVCVQDLSKFPVFGSSKGGATRKCNLRRFDKKRAPPPPVSNPLQTKTNWYSSAPVKEVLTTILEDWQEDLAAGKNPYIQRSPSPNERMEIDFDVFGGDTSFQMPLDQQQCQELGTRLADFLENDAQVITETEEPPDSPSESDSEEEPELDPMDVLRAGCVRNILHPREVAGSNQTTNLWYPWPDRETCVLDILRHIPRLQNLPSSRVMDTIDMELQALCGIKTLRHEGKLGHVYYTNDFAGIIAQEMANPRVRRDLHFYPEDSSPSLSEAWQADRWLKELDSQLTTPMIRIFNQDFYLQEPARLRDGRLVIPIRWFMRDGVSDGAAVSPWKGGSDRDNGMNEWCIKADGRDGQHNGILARDFILNEDVIIILSVLAMLGDNPMQSELSCHVGFNGNLFCRVCEVSGSVDGSEDDLSNPGPTAVPTNTTLDNLFSTSIGVRAMQTEDHVDGGSDVESLHSHEAESGGDATGDDNMSIANPSLGDGRGPLLSTPTVAQTAPPDTPPDGTQTAQSKKKRGTKQSQEGSDGKKKCASRVETREEMATRYMNFMKVGNLRSRSTTEDELKSQFVLASSLRSKTKAEKRRTISGITDRFQLFFLEKLFAITTAKGTSDSEKVLQVEAMKETFPKKSRVADSRSKAPISPAGA